MPNSFSELNQYANSALTYTDNRPYSITFSANAAANTSTTIDEDDYFIIPTGIDITNVVSQPGNITYSIDISGYGGDVILSWPTLPAGISSSTPSTNVYSITGIFSAETWDQAKQANVIFPDEENGFSFSASLSYPNTANTSLTNTWSWTNVVEVANTNPDVFITQSYSIAEDEVTTLEFLVDDTDPTIIDYTMSISPRAGTTGTLLLNGVSVGVGNAATVTGNIATVNAANIAYVPYPDDTSNISLRADSYKTNSTGNVSMLSNVDVSLNITSTHNEYSIPSTYDENTYSSQITITDTDQYATEYTISIQQTDGVTGSWYVNGSEYSDANIAYSITDTKANINSSNIRFLPALNNTGNVTLVFNQSKTNSIFGNISQASNVTQIVPVATTYPEISNMIDRTYQSNNVNSIFSASTPYINDGPDYGQTYTITLSSTLGRFANSESALLSAGNTYSYTGNLSSVNSEFSSMKFLPFIGESGNGTFSYTQQRNGVSQVSSTHNLTGTAVPFSGQTYTWDYPGTYSWTPTAAEAYYGNVTMLLVGGGGGGSGALSQAGGGGSGGGAYQINNASLAVVSHTITVGGGGTSATSTAPSGSIINIRGNPGGNSHIIAPGSYTHSINGGEGGECYYNSGVSRARGGNCINPWDPSNATYNNYGGQGFTISGAVDSGGGGAGSRLDGANGYSSGGFAIGGAGGGGLTTSITGTSVTYGPGGKGGDSYTNGATGANGTGAGGGGAEGVRSPGSGGGGIVVIKIA